jgi:pimeloyl-ACP methyl ester carboxylesterase
VIRVSDGTRLHVDDEGSGRPVVLIGGYGMAGTAWTLQRNHLRDRHRVVTIDRRCHGLSDKVAHGQRMARHGKDIADVLDALDLDQVLLVGSSMGSNTVLAYVDLFGTARLRGVVLIDQTPKMVNEDGWQLGFHGLRRDGLDAFVRAFPGDLNPFHTLPPPEVLALTASAFSVDDTRDLLRDHAEKDWRDVILRVDVPLLAVAGRHSPVWPWESSAWMAEKAPYGELAILERSGHVPFLEEPASFNALLDKATAY